jgi:MFS family permease
LSYGFLYFCSIKLLKSILLIDLNFISRFKTKAKYKKTYKNAKISYLNRIRWAVSMFYFAMGLCFATWASRIPDIKTALHLSEGELGTILFALPLGQLAIMPFSGKLVTRFGSHRILIISLLFYTGLFVFGVFGNLANIAVNTQGVYTEVLFKKTIMSSFHGMWSFAGFTGALVGLGMLTLELTPYDHFIVVAAIVLVMIALNFKFLIKAKEKIKTKKKKLFTKPDSALIWLGVIGFQRCDQSSWRLSDFGLYFVYDNDGRRAFPWRWFDS